MFERILFGSSYYLLRCGVRNRSNLCCFYVTDTLLVKLLTSIAFETLLLPIKHKTAMETKSKLLRDNMQARWTAKIKSYNEMFDIPILIKWYKHIRVLLTLVYTWWVRKYFIDFYWTNSSSILPAKQSN